MAAQTVPLARVMPADDLAALTKLGGAASGVGAHLWVVGGAVRDALLGRPVVDIDLTSNMPATELAQAMGIEVRARSQFSTVKLRVGACIVDLATIRSEHYARPGALPSVSPGTMESDLARRDFSINAMAISLNPGDFGALTDHHGGLADLGKGLIRGMHTATFQDDATRALRAVRYAAKLDFRLHRATRRWLRRDLGFIDAISPARIHRELVRTLAEPTGARALLLAHRLGLLTALDPTLGVSHAALRLASRHGLTGDALLGVLFSQASPDSPARRLGLTAKGRRVVHHVHRLLGENALTTPRLPASHVADILGDAPGEAVAAVAALHSAEARRNLRRHRRHADGHPILSGHDLLAMGIPQGERIGTITRALAAAALDGKVKTRRGEVTFVRRLLQRGGDG